MYCYNSASNPSPNVGSMPSWWETDVNVVKDGDKWCATREGFENLQVSAAGFGDTPASAVAELLNTRHTPPPEAERCEPCTCCGEMVSDWVDPEWAGGRICRPCEAKYEPKEAKPPEASADVERIGNATFKEIFDSARKHPAYEREGEELAKTEHPDVAMIARDAAYKCAHHLKSGIGTFKAAMEIAKAIAPIVAHNEHLLALLKEANAKELPRLEEIQLIYKNTALQGEIDQLRAENEQLREDKARLDWLDDDTHLMSISATVGGWKFKRTTGEQNINNHNDGLRAAITAAMQGEKKEKT
jgi:hypothetical protein